MEYIRGTRDLNLILRSNGIGFLKWWTDASYAVNPNMQGNTGGGIFTGRGFSILTSNKKKLKKRS